MSNNKREVIIGGVYRHYKGNVYRVTGVATHTETEEKLVIYCHPQSVNPKVWARPLDMFLEDVNGQPRFKFLCMG